MKTPLRLAALGGSVLTMKSMISSLPLLSALPAASRTVPEPETVSR